MSSVVDDIHQVTLTDTLSMPRFRLITLIICTAVAALLLSIAKVHPVLCVIATIAFIIGYLLTLPVVDVERAINVVYFASILTVVAAIVLTVSYAHGEPFSYITKGRLIQFVGISCSVVTLAACNTGFIVGCLSLCSSRPETKWVSGIVSLFMLAIAFAAAASVIDDYAKPARAGGEWSTKPR